MSKRLQWVVAALLAVATAISTWWWTQQYQSDLQSFHILKLKDDVGLKKNVTIIKDSMLEVVDLPSKFEPGLKDATITTAYRARVRDQKAVVDVPPGAILLNQYFSLENTEELSDSIDAGQRALTVAVNAESTVGYFVRPGSRVDLVGTFLEPGTGDANGDSRMNVHTRMLLENVKVLAVGSARSFAEYNQTSSYGTVTLQLTPDQANLVVFAQQQLSGPLTMVLRRGDEKVDPAKKPSPVDWKSLQTTFSSQNTGD